MNWPDLRRDYDSVVSCVEPIPNLDEWIDLIWEGITTLLSMLWGHNTSLLEWIDLIWEGITTFFGLSQFLPVLRVNWPDLRRDYDLFSPNDYSIVLQEWIDLIWEGITTWKSLNITNVVVFRVNWPDLRRDYDLHLSWCIHRLQYQEWIDLIWEGITTFLHSAFSLFSWTMSELTWFEKGLRPLPLLRIIYVTKVSELTWFEKGLRPVFWSSFLIFSLLSELTWFEKGLRLRKRISIQKSIG